MPQILCRVHSPGSLVDCQHSTASASGISQRADSRACKRREHVGGSGGHAFFRPHCAGHSRTSARLPYRRTCGKGGPLSSAVRAKDRWAIGCCNTSWRSDSGIGGWLVSLLSWRLCSLLCYALATDTALCPRPCQLAQCSNSCGTCCCAFPCSAPTHYPPYPSCCRRLGNSVASR